MRLFYSFLPLFLSFHLNVALANSLPPVSGHIKSFYTSAEQSEDSLALDLRLSQQGGDVFSWAWDYQLQASNKGQAPDDQTQLFDLTQTLYDQQQLVWHRLDRLHLSYTQANYSVRFGRQSFSWGQGLAFHPMDLMNPFSPLILDKSYKPGIDMLNAQWLLDDGSDMTLLVIPRRDMERSGIEQQQSSIGLFGRRFIQDSEIQWMLAQDYEDLVLGVGLSFDWLQGQWQLDWVPAKDKKDQWYQSAVINYQNGLTIGNRNLNWFIEYYRNGFGENDLKKALFSQKLREKLLRNQLFVMRQDYVDAGFILELTPLLTMQWQALTAIEKWDGQQQFSFDYSLADDWSATAGFSQKLSNSEEFQQVQQKLFLNLSGHF